MPQMQNNKPKGKITYFNKAQITCPAAPEMLHITPNNPNVAKPRKMTAIFHSFSGACRQFDFVGDLLPDAVFIVDFHQFIFAEITVAVIFCPAADYRADCIFSIGKFFCSLVGRVKPLAVLIVFPDVIDTIFAEKSVPASVGFGKPQSVAAAGLHRSVAHIAGKRFAVVIPEFENVVEIGGFEAVKNIVGDSDDAHDTFPFILAC